MEIKDQYRNLVAPRCRYCHGVGETDAVTCGCVNHKKFFHCLDHYEKCRTSQHNKLAGCVKKEIPSVLYSRPTEEYITDFESTCLRALKNETNRKIFKAFCVDAMTTKQTAQAVRLPLGILILRGRRIWSFLGKTLAAVKPYPLYPPAAYANHPIKRTLGKIGKL